MHDSEPVPLTGRVPLVVQPPTGAPLPVMDTVITALTFFGGLTLVLTKVLLTVIVTVQAPGPQPVKAALPCVLNW
ncbi:hypothetical protein [Streptomyces sp. NBC_01353]|uniref:hypothetical protein n=1 Tax=Streptomyces sp. NBC_01353 TaxID=2903835 RepID=UPI002E330543|nr:hypothetical protein [Streptomyces sp. NBC_01353]